MWTLPLFAYRVFGNMEAPSRLILSLSGRPVPRCGFRVRANLACRLLADSVEEVREPNEAGLACKGCRPFLGRQWGREWHQFVQLPKVLGSCCEEELVTGTIWSS